MFSLSADTPDPTLVTLGRNAEAGNDFGAIH